MEDFRRQKFYIDNGRGRRLAALLFCPDAARAGRSSTGAGPVVVVCHGFTGSKEGGGRALSMAGALARLGYNCLLFDFTGCGESEGRWEELTLSGQVDDLDSVVDWCIKGGFKPVILNGRSFGGTTALCCAARDRERRIDAVCTWAAAALLPRLFNFFSREIADLSEDELVEIEDGDQLLYLKKEFFRDLANHDVIRCAAALGSRPLLVIHGTEDELVPLKDAHLIYGAAAGPKRICLVRGADHRFTDHIDLVWDEFFRWLRQNLPPV